MTSRLSRSGSTDTASWPGGPEVPFRPIDPWGPTGPRSASRTCGTPVTAATAPPAPQAAANNPSAAILAVAERRLMDWSVHLPDVTDGQRDQIAHAALHFRPPFKAKRETEWSAPRGANTHRPGFDSRHLSRKVWDGPRSHVGSLTSARDEGEGVGAATIRTAPRPPTLGDHRTRTRIVSMVWLVFEALLFASRDAGPRPAPRLPRSRLTWRGLTISERSLAGTHGHIGALLTLFSVRSGVHSFHSQAECAGSIPSPAPHAKCIAAQSDQRAVVLSQSEFSVHARATGPTRQGH